MLPMEGSLPSTPPDQYSHWVPAAEGGTWRNMQSEDLVLQGQYEEDNRSLTSDCGLVVVRVGVVGVVHLDTLSLQLLHFAFQVPLGPQEVLDLLFFGLPKNLVVVLSDL